MIGNGLLIMLTTLIAGLGLWMSLLGGFELIPGTVLKFTLPGTAEGWARAHRGTPMNALMLIGIALALPKLRFSSVGEKRLAWTMIGTAWANTLFYFASNWAGNRGLSFGDNIFGSGNIVSFVALGPAYLFGVLSMGALAIMARKAFD
jgi:styrene-oxide isomerase